MNDVLAPESTRALACDFLPYTHSVTDNMKDDLFRAEEFNTLSESLSIEFIVPIGVFVHLPASWTQTTTGDA